jgi:hypothetical protein
MFSLSSGRQDYDTDFNFAPLYMYAGGYMLHQLRDALYIAADHLVFSSEMW